MPAYNNTIFKGTHNSGVGGWPLGIVEQLDFHRDRPGMPPVQSIELDICQLSDGHGFYMSHSRREAGPHITRTMEALRDWQGRWPDHEVITVMVDIKWIADMAALPGDIDTMIVRSGLKLFTPADILRSKHETLRDAVLSDGWPDTDDLRGKFLFVVTGRGSQPYVRGEAPKGDLKAFGSFDWRFPDRKDAGRINNNEWQLFVSVGRWERSVYDRLKRVRESIEPHVILRTWGGASETDYRRALELKVNIISMDNIELGGEE